MRALEIKNLKKNYDNNFQALKGVDLVVEEGDFFALLGPNGAGKTTMIGIITSIVNKTSGKVKIFGNDLDLNVDEAKRYIGVVPQEFNFGLWDKVINIVINQAGYYGISKSVAIVRAEKYLRQLGLWDKRNDEARMLSGGLKRRLMIARALVHEPKLLILDEPTAGVDIEIRRSTWDFIKDLNKNGTTIILTTHYLEEAEELCKNIAIIDKGKIIENTTMKKLISKLCYEVIVLDLKDKLIKVPKMRDCKITLIDDTTLEVEISKKNNLNELFDNLSKLNIEVLSMRNKTNRLEELFLNLVNKKEIKK